MIGKIASLLLFISVSLVWGKKYDSCTLLTSYASQLEEEGVISSPKSLTAANTVHNHTWCIASQDLCKQVVLVLENFEVGNKESFTQFCAENNFVEIGGVPYCGKSTTNHTIQTNDSSVLIASSVLNTEKPADFRIRYYFQESNYGNCGGFKNEIELTEEGVITNPNYPASLPAPNCVWRIRSTGKDKPVNLVVREFMVNGRYPLKEICWYNKALVINGKLYCGQISSNNHIIETGASEVEISAADLSVNNLVKFRIEYYFGRLPNKSNETNSSFPIHLIKEGVIESSPEEVSVTKQWRITSPNPCKQVILVFKQFSLHNNKSLNMNCQSSNLKVNQLTLCGLAPANYVLKTGLSEVNIVADLKRQDEWRNFTIEYYFGNISSKSKEKDTSDKESFLNLFGKLIGAVETVASVLKEMLGKLSA